MFHIRRLFGIALACFGLLITPACGGGDDDDSASVDANNNGTPDAPDNNQPDANQSTSNAIGDACTPGGTAQGDCPDGHICLSLQGGSRPWCSKLCDPMDTTVDTCGDGYTGPGASVCLLGVTVDDGTDAGQQQFNACIIMCEDNTGTNTCTTSCDGTCPIGLNCSDTGAMWSACT